MFYSRINGQLRTTLDVAIGGTLVNKLPKDAWALMEEMTSNVYQLLTERSIARRVASVHEVDIVKTLTVKVELISKDRCYCGK